MNQYQELAIRALEDTRGDNAARARLAFGNCTREQMQELYRESGQTRAQILAGHVLHDAKVEAAMDWIREQSA